MMFLVRCVVITVLANIMASMRVTVVLASSNGQFVVIGNMCARQSRKDIASWIRHTEISVVRVVSRSVLMLVWIKMRFNMNGDLAIRHFANKWLCLSRKTRHWDTICWCLPISRCQIHICLKWDSIWVFHGCTRFWHRHICMAPSHIKHLQQHIPCSQLNPFESPQRSYSSWTSISWKISHLSRNFPCPINCCFSRNRGVNFSS